MIYNISDSSNQPPLSSSRPYFVDANILYYFHVSCIYNSFKRRKIEAFSNLILNLRMNGNFIAVSSFNLQEVLHAIERFEYDAYCDCNGEIHKKEYRRLINERQNVKNKLELAFMQINSNYKLMDDKLEFSHIQSFISEFDTHVYDPMDYFTISTRKSESFYYITDDTDFKYDPFFSNASHIHLITY